MRSIILPVQLTTVRMDGGEYGIYVGSEDGRIFAINLLELGDSSAEILAGFDDDRNEGVGGEAAKKVRTFRGHTQRITGLAFSIEETLLVSSSLDHSVKVWEIHSGQCLRTMKFTWQGIQIPFASMLIMPQYAEWTTAEQRKVHGGQQANNGSVGAKKRKAASCLPLAVLAKYEVAPGGLITDGDSGSSKRLASNAMAMGLLKGRLALSATDVSINGAEKHTLTDADNGGTASIGQPTVGTRETASQNEVDELGKQLAEAQESATHYKKLHTDLFNECLKSSIS